MNPLANFTLLDVFDFRTRKEHEYLLEEAAMIIKSICENSLSKYCIIKGQIQHKNTEYLMFNGFQVFKTADNDTLIAWEDLDIDIEAQMKDMIKLSCKLSK
jgi:hypothetical protein